MKFTDAVDMYLAVVVVAVAARAAADVRHARKLGVLRHSGRRGERMSRRSQKIEAALIEAGLVGDDAPWESVKRMVEDFADAEDWISAAADGREYADLPPRAERFATAVAVLEGRPVLEGGENAVIRDEWPKPAKDPCYDRNGSRYCTRPKGHEGDHRWDYEPEGCPVLEGGENER